MIWEEMTSSLNKVFTKKHTYLFIFDRFGRAHELAGEVAPRAKTYTTQDIGCQQLREKLMEYLGFFSAVLDNFL